jgi:hypothetical protein
MIDVADSTYVVRPVVGVVHTVTKSKIIMHDYLHF